MGHRPKQFGGWKDGLLSPRKEAFLQRLAACFSTLFLFLPLVLEFLLETECSPYSVRATENGAVNKINPDRKKALLLRTCSEWEKEQIVTAPGRSRNGRNR